MNVTLQDARNLGFVKIYSNFYGDIVHKKRFECNIEKYNALLSGFKLQPYSALTHWGIYSKVPDSDANGIKSLLKDVTPMLDLESIDASCRRKFRNTWNSIWQKFGEVNGLTPTEISILSDVCLKTPVVLNAYLYDTPEALKLIKDDSLLSNTFVTGFIVEICELTNAVVNWYLLTQFESNITTRGKSIFDLIKVMCVMGNDEFTSILKGGLDLWD